MRIAKKLTLGIAAGAAAIVALGAAWAQRQTPYYASIDADQARMRTGPGRQYPASWMYVRRDLPVMVIASYDVWRKVEDPDGTQGWMFANLLSDTRTAIVKGGIVEMRAAPALDARVNWRAEPGVVGRISKCQRNWCWFDVRGRGGYVEQAKLWGTELGETVP